MSDSDGIKRLRHLAARRKRLSMEIDELTETLLRGGEYVGNVADALDVSRETIRRFRDARKIPDAREIRRARDAAADPADAD